MPQSLVPNFIPEKINNSASQFGSKSVILSQINFENTKDNISPDNLHQEDYDDFFDSWVNVLDIKNVNDIPENRMQIELPSEYYTKTLTLIQREFCVITNKSDYLIIGTCNLGPNVAIVGYEPVLKIAFVAHFDINTKLEADTFLNHLPPGNYETYIIGGLTGYSELLVDAVFKLSKLLPNLNFNLVGRCVLGSVHDPKSIYINRTDGKIYTFSGPILDPEFWNRGNNFTKKIIGSITPLQFLDSSNMYNFS